MSAAPPAFNPRTSFSTLAQQPITTTGLPGSQLDGEFSRAADSINQIRNRLSEVQRDDGKLRNGVVSTEALSEDLRNILISSGSKPVTWTIGGQFAVGDFVSNPPGTPGTYLCTTAHTSSSVFANDLANWALIAAQPTVGILYTDTFIGNGTTTNFTLSQEPASINNTQVFIDGIYQPKGGYSIDENVLTITPAPSSGSDIEVVIGVPSTSSTVTVTDGAISSVKIETGAVTTAKIAALAVIEDKLADGAVSSAKLATSAVSTAKLANGAVTNAKLGQESVTSEKIVDGAVTANKLAPLSVSSDKIANSSITQAKIAPAAITEAAIVDGAVTQAKAGNMLLPSGAVMAFAMNSAPTGWLAANGALVSTTTYASLFAAIGYTYGGSGGSFNLPDLRGEFVRGFDAGRGVDTGRAIGSAQLDAFQNITGTAGRFDVGFSGATSTGAFTHTLSTHTIGGGGSGNHSTVSFDASRVARTSTETRPRNIAMLYCIKI